MIKKVHIKIIAAVIFSFISSAGTYLSAQKLVTPEFKPVDHEISAFIGGGVHTALYKTDLFNKKWGMGSAFGVQYTYYLNSEWGLSTGCEISFYNGSITGSTTEKYQVHNKIEILDYNVDYYNIKENHHYTFLQIPFMARCKYPFKSVMLYGAAGFKIGFNVKSNYKTHIEDILTTAKYEGTNTLYRGELEDGYGRYSNQKGAEVVVVKTTFMAALETGVEIFLKSKHSLLIGAYFEYGLNNIAKPASPIRKIMEYKENFVVNSNSETLKIRGVIDSGAGEKPYFEKINLLSIGIKVGYKLGIPQ